MLANGRWRSLGFSSLLVVVFAALAPVGMASSEGFSTGPSIRILEPTEGEELPRKRTITVDIKDGKGQMVAVYFDMVEVKIFPNFHMLTHGDRRAYMKSGLVWFESVKRIIF